MAQENTGSGLRFGGSSQREQISRTLMRPQVLVLLPIVQLGVYWLAGETALVVTSIVLPFLLLIFVGKTDDIQAPHKASTGLLDRNVFNDTVEGTHQKAVERGRHAAIFVIALEDFAQVAKRYGQGTADQVVNRVGERLVETLRDNDTVSQIGDARFAICTEPVRHLDLELCIQMAGRFQSVIEEPISIDGLGVFVSASVGFCQHERSPTDSGAEWLSAATTALQEAQRRGPSAIRAFSDQMRRASQTRSELREEVAAALDSGQIQPWFQPQLSTDTGKITGFEALARWSHPDRGMISPAEFLPAIEEAGLLERLAEKMMYHSFAAMKAWDGAKARVPQVGVNFAGSELNNPRLLEKIEWELDRFELTPDRLAVEVLETVVAAEPDDMVTRNIKALGDMGCRIDLDDFGTGNASITAIRRFAVSRIKIDRSFVIKADQDPEQQRMISAILTMAERLEVETLAEGVETVGEHVLLAQLGCDHVQGFGIARPMPFDQTLDWIARHNAKLREVPRIMNGKET